MDGGDLGFDRVGWICYYGFTLVISTSWRGGRVAEGSGLLNRRIRNRIPGVRIPPPPPVFNFWCLLFFLTLWLIRQSRHFLA